VKLIGASPTAHTAYREAPFEAATAIFVGSEGAGLEASLRDVLDVMVRIPMRAGVESLNVAVAAAVLLFEAAARRGNT
jgi:TrmH family RNA methyltransferase